MKDAPTPKACVCCGREFIPRYTTTQVACSITCAKKYAKRVRLAKVAIRKQALERIPDLIKAAQKEFNAYIRARDRHQPCICCGHPLGHGDVGGAYDCGHYRSTGSAPHLRFDERNAHAQRKVCNRYGAGRAVDYRIGLIARIGREAVEALEADNRIHKWTREELRAIRETYKAKRKALEHLNASPLSEEA